MRESPLIQELVTKATTRVRHEYLLLFLKGRFETVPPDLITAIQDIGAESQLDRLVGFAGKCPNLDAFRARVQSVAGCRGRAGR